MEPRFHGKTVVVTGAAGGIGRAAAIRFGSEGANVVVVDLPDSGLKETATAVEKTGGRILAVYADVTRVDDVMRYTAAATAEFGAIDCFFSNAGILGVVTPLLEYPEEVFDRVLAVNVKGTWLGMKVVGEAMRSRGGAIVNTASVAGLHGTPRLIAYGASKHAVVGMTRTAAVELARYRIRVNAVCPSPIETPMVDQLEAGYNPDAPATSRQRLTSRIPLGRYGRPEEVAALAAFLCSADAEYITGAIYPIDGGSTA
jgi:NAD(P)-dependent dehydrogenase (short-subunit alcohol dehydrogenase family)